MIDREQLLEFWHQHSAKIVGALIGFLFGLFMMWIGLFWTLVISGTTLAGYWIGSRVDHNPNDLPDWIERILSGGRR